MKLSIFTLTHLTLKTHKTILKSWKSRLWDTVECETFIILNPKEVDKYFYNSISLACHSNQSIPSEKFEYLHKKKEEKIEQWSVGV